MNSDIMRELDGAAWNQVNPDNCPCQGRGWLLSDFDTWHRCQMHGAGVPHPEDEVGIPEGHLRAMYIEAYRIFRHQAMRAGIRTAKGFETLCRSLMDAGLYQKSPMRAWVNAAEQVAFNAETTMAERDARRHGFSCALEARWADETYEGAWH